MENEQQLMKIEDSEQNGQISIDETQYNSQEEHSRQHHQLTSQEDTFQMNKTINFLQNENDYSMLQYQIHSKVLSQSRKDKRNKDVQILDDIHNHLINSDQTSQFNQYKTNHEVSNYFDNQRSNNEIFPEQNDNEGNTQNAQDGYLFLGEVKMSESNPSQSVMSNFNMMGDQSANNNKETVHQIISTESQFKMSSPINQYFVNGFMQQDQIEQKLGSSNNFPSGMVSENNCSRVYNNIFGQSFDNSQMIEEYMNQQRNSKQISEAKQYMNMFENQKNNHQNLNNQESTQSFENSVLNTQGDDASSSQMQYLTKQSLNRFQRNPSFNPNQQEENQIIAASASLESLNSRNDPGQYFFNGIRQFQIPQSPNDKSSNQNFGIEQDENIFQNNRMLIHDFASFNPLIEQIQNSTQSTRENLHESNYIFKQKAAQIQDQCENQIKKMMETMLYLKQQNIQLQNQVRSLDNSKSSLIKQIQTEKINTKLASKLNLLEQINQNSSDEDINAQKNSGFSSINFIHKSIGQGIISSPDKLIQKQESFNNLIKNYKSEIQNLNNQISLQKQNESNFINQIELLQQQFFQQRDQSEYQKHVCLSLENQNQILSQKIEEQNNYKYNLELQIQQLETALFTLQKQKDFQNCKVEYPIYQLNYQKSDFQLKMSNMETTLSSNQNLLLTDDSVINKSLKLLQRFEDSNQIKKRSKSTEKSSKENTQTIHLKESKNFMNLRNHFSQYSMKMILQQQISSVLLTEKIIKENKNKQNLKQSKIQDIEQGYVKIEQALQNILDEREKLHENIKVLQKENSQIKKKFTKILGKFQQYIDDQDKDHVNINVEQANKINILEMQIEDLNKNNYSLISQINSNQELLNKKHSFIDSFQIEKQELLARIDYFQQKTDKLQQQLNESKFEQVKIQSLNQEIAYLKNYQTEELKMYKEQNKMLKLNIAQNCQNSIADIENLKLNRACSAKLIPREVSSIQQSVVNGQRSSLYQKSTSMGNSRESIYQHTSGASELMETKQIADRANSTDCHLPRFNRDQNLFGQIKIQNEFNNNVSQPHSALDNYDFQDIKKQEWNLQKDKLNPVNQLLRTQTLSQNFQQQQIINDFLATYKVQFNQMEQELQEKQKEISQLKQKVNKLQKQIKEENQFTIKDQIHKIKILTQENDQLRQENEIKHQQNQKMIQKNETNDVILQNLNKYLGTLSKKEYAKLQNCSQQNQCAQDIINRIEVLISQKSILQAQSVEVNAKIESMQNQQDLMLNIIQQKDKFINELMANKIQEHQDPTFNPNLIRQKIVKIAELYEKKQICKEKYSTEILCDYILDKSKKQFLKIERMRSSIQALSVKN